MEHITSKVTEAPRTYPDTDESGRTALRRWRHKAGLPVKEVASRFGVSVATLYRYEDEGIRSLEIANQIVIATNGKVRYRDLVHGFRPEFA